MRNATDVGKMTKIVNMFPEEWPVRNIRLMAFRDYNAFDKEAYTYEFVEVYYEDGVPHSWARVSLPYIDSLDIENSGKTLKNAVNKEWNSFKREINEALNSPVIYEEELITQ